MESMIRGALGLAFLVLLAGVAAVVVPLPNVQLPELSVVVDTLRASATNPWVLGLAGGSAALWLASHFADRTPSAPRAGRKGFLPALPPGLSSMAAAQQTLDWLRQRFDPRGIQSSLDATSIVEALIHAAVQSQASDVHLSPREDGSRVALRVHGGLEEVAVLTSAQHAQLVNRLKVLSQMVIYVTDRPQDGHFTVTTPDGVAEVRISFLPTQHGENVVMRVGQRGTSPQELSALGLGDRLEVHLQALLTKPQGLLFFTGPTGSGKTTSIYASLAHIHRSRGATTRIATIEDPIEYGVAELAQTQVNSATGMSFAEGLRAVLRQDPNVIMVGEIRDSETARIAVQAGLTGHLIVTTVHADSAAGVFTRMLEMGVEPYVLASVALACVSQRLVKRLCPHCRRTEQPNSAQIGRLEAAGLRVTPFCTPTGCPQCAGVGYIGRAAVYEVLIVSAPLRELMQQRVSTAQLMQLAVSEGTVPLLEAAVEQARAGVTTLDEAFRVAG